MIEIKDKKDCCGCNACGDICPNNAIDFSTDIEGFWYPTVNQSKCIGCGLCNNICPVITQCKSKNVNDKKPVCYVAEHRSVEVVFSSTSGGMFSALAEYMYSHNGYVGGAVHNEDFSVSHFISNSKADLKRLRRSKDLQSNAEGFYKEVKGILDADKGVLVCGVPCQIAGLINYLGKDYDNLVTIDLICAGVNSPKVWRKYLDYIEELNSSHIIWTENKSKEYGWNNLTQKFIFEDGKEYFDTRKTSLFTHGYIESHLYCRPSCYDCRFKGFPRVSDITIGDFWGITNYSNNYNSDMGTSLVLINSKKGKDYFELIKKRINYEDADLDWALSGNPALSSSISILSDKRTEFFSDLDNLRFDQLIEKYSVSKKSHIKTYLRKLKKKLGFIRRVVNTTRLNPVALYQTIKYSGIKNLLKGKGILCGTNSHIKIDKTADLEFEGVLTFGRKEKFVRSKQESRLFVGKNATFKVLGDFEIDSDCELVVFENAELIIHGGKHSGSDANTGLCIICGEKIEILSDVGIGRKVTIRDTNGASHYINTTGYRPSRPIEIGEKAWICEAATIMPGVKIGRGAIVGGCSMVTKSVPAHAMVSGIPACVVQENVLWKW
ncbi:MAG: Coenzyme F420 hydrogenase/dehydrogenase, beta subunit C-terminal domain [Saccharofermentans sp.]|nr:Coenzyme F420 hydrogenase/dehydrogenase, beta subunit C-terminal domain [Saccharofermentans sp.]